MPFPEKGTFVSPEQNTPLALYLRNRQRETLNLTA